MLWCDDILWWESVVLCRNIPKACDLHIPVFDWIYPTYVAVYFTVFILDWFYVFELLGTVTNNYLILSNIKRQNGPMTKDG